MTKTRLGARLPKPQGEVQIVAFGDLARLATLRSPETYRRGESLQRMLTDLSPQNDVQRQLQARRG